MMWRSDATSAALSALLVTLYMQYCLSMRCSWHNCKCYVSAMAHHMIHQNCVAITWSNIYTTAEGVAICWQSSYEPARYSWVFLPQCSVLHMSPAHFLLLYKGLLCSKGLHCSSVSDEQHQGWFLGDGVAVSHTYHCASDQLQGGKAGKGVLTLCHSTVMIMWQVW